jgi:hypothetical protein
MPIATPSKVCTTAGVTGKPRSGAGTYQSCLRLRTVTRIDKSARPAGFSAPCGVLKDRVLRKGRNRGQLRAGRDCHRTSLALPHRSLRSCQRGHRLTRIGHHTISCRRYRLNIRRVGGPAPPENRGLISAGCHYSPKGGLFEATGRGVNIGHSTTGWHPSVLVASCN